MRNPYVISFGRIPTQYISRSLLIDNIIETLESDVVEEQAFKLTGIRGTGKTVTLTAIEKADSLTFFLRATRCEMTPLNITMIRCDYEKILGVSREVAEEMVYMTKGYPFAYQALGKYMWDTKSDCISEEVLALLDEALSEKVYKKIWSELSPTDKWFMQFIVQRDQMQASYLLDITKKKHNEWSVPRKN